jgi:hypothetical protein
MIDLEQEGRTILAQVSKDLSNSGWVWNSSGAIVFPKVYPAWNLQGTQPTDPDNLFGNSIEFASINITNSIEGTDWFNFSSPYTPMADWETPRTTVPELIFDNAYTTQVGKRLVMPIWEPRQEAGGAPWKTNRDYGDNTDLTNIRTYLYQVVPSPNTGRGTLRRFYRDGNAAAPEHDTRMHDLGMHIHSFVVTPVMNTQRIRIELELRHDPPGKARVIRSFVTNVAMRSAY